MADTLLASRSDPAIATCLYEDVPDDADIRTSLAVLRAEHDQSRAQMLAEIRRLETLLESKHASQSERVLNHEERLGQVEGRLHTLFGYPGNEVADRGGTIGSHARQLRKLWERDAERKEELARGKIERWKLAAYLAASGTGGAGILKLLESLLGG